MMYEYVSDILRAKRIEPKDVMLIRHTDSRKDEEHRFVRAREAGYIKEYTAMQAAGFADKVEYLFVFLGEPRKTAQFYALYNIANRFPSRKGHVPADYPNQNEVEADGEYMELREESLPQDLQGYSFVIDWGAATQAWHQSALKEKRIISIQKAETGGTQA